MFYRAEIAFDHFLKLDFKFIEKLNEVAPSIKLYGGHHSMAISIPLIGYFFGLTINYENNRTKLLFLFHKNEYNVIFTHGYGFCLDRNNDVGFTIGYFKVGGLQGRGFRLTQNIDNTPCYESGEFTDNALKRSQTYKLTLPCSRLGIHSNNEKHSIFDLHSLIFQPTHEINQDDKTKEIIEYYIQKEEIEASHETTFHERYEDTLELVTPPVYKKTLHIVVKPKDHK
ncbi:MAG: hypothetical protein HRT90_11650 [Candidatus Margulisbacteria bacterium]|nr:hypothetical protein [Candidatus Margulisiibacteriota bacterium]